MANEPLTPPRDPLKRGPGGKRKRDPGGPNRRGHADNPVVQVTGAASPIEEQPDDYMNADAVYSTGGGNVQSYHYHREPTYRDQYAAENAQVESVNVSGPGQGGRQ